MRRGRFWSGADGTNRPSRAVPPRPSPARCPRTCPRAANSASGRGRDGPANPTIRRLHAQLVFVTRQHIDPQHQPQAGHDVAMIAVRRPARFVRVVTNRSAFLVSIQWLRRSVDVEHRGLAQQGCRAIVKMAPQPAQTGRLVNPGKVAPQRVLAHQLVHPEQRRVHRMHRSALTWASDNVRPTSTATAFRAGRACVEHSAAQHQGAVGDPGIEQPTLLQIGDENGNCPSGVTGLVGSHSTCARPPNVSAVAKVLQPGIVHPQGGGSALSCSRPSPPNPPIRPPGASPDLGTRFSAVGISRRSRSPPGRPPRFPCISNACPRRSLAWCG